MGFEPWGAAWQATLLTPPATMAGSHFLLFHVQLLHVNYYNKKLSLFQNVNVNMLHISKSAIVDVDVDGQSKQLEKCRNDVNAVDAALFITPSLLQNDKFINYFSSYKNVTNGSRFFMTTEKCDQDEMDQLQIFLWHCNFQQKTDQLAHSTSTQID